VSVHAGPEPGPLQLASTDELIDELGRRHKAYLAIYEKPSEKASADTSDHRIVYGGGWTQALGLLEYLAACMAEAMQRCAARVEDLDEVRRGGPRCTCGHVRAEHQAPGAECVVPACDCPTYDGPRGDEQ